MFPRLDGLRTLELGTPGEMRARLNALVLSGQKVATAGILVEYEEEGEALETVGEVLVLVDDEVQEIGRVEVTSVDVVRFDEVTWEFAESEGEGFTSVEDWRAGHKAFWSAVGIEVTASSRIACIGFRLL